MIRGNQVRAKYAQPSRILGGGGGSQQKQSKDGEKECMMHTGSRFFMILCPTGGGKVTHCFGDSRAHQSNLHQSNNWKGNQKLIWKIRRILLLQSIFKLLQSKNLKHV